MFCKFVVISLALLLPYNTASAKRNYDINLNYANVSMNEPLLVEKLHMATYKNKLNNYVFSQFTMKENVSAFNLRVKFDMLRKDDAKINLINVEMDGCKFLGGTYENAVMKIIANELKRISNFPRDCPLMAGMQYTVNNLTVNPDNFPPMVPAMNWILTISIWIAKVHRGDIIIKGTVIRH